MFDTATALAEPALVAAKLDLTVPGGQVASARLKHTATMIAGAVRVGFLRATATSKSQRLVFDLESRHLSYLYLKGGNFLLDKDGKEVGRIDGQFVLTGSLDETARLWPVASPLEGEPGAVRRRVQGVTGAELTPSGRVRGFEGLGTQRQDKARN